MAGIIQAKKAGYPLDMEGFWLGDKFWIIAVTFYWYYVHVASVSPCPTTTDQCWPGVLKLHGIEVSWF